MKFEANPVNCSVSSISVIYHKNKNQKPKHQSSVGCSARVMTILSLRKCWRVSSQGVWADEAPGEITKTEMVWGTVLVFLSWCQHESRSTRAHLRTALSSARLPVQGRQRGNVLQPGSVTLLILSLLPLPERAQSHPIAVDCSWNREGGKPLLQCKHLAPAQHYHLTRQQRGAYVFWLSDCKWHHPPVFHTYKGFSPGL